MALIKYKGVGIKAISACVPKSIEYNKNLGYLIPEEEIEKTIHSIGIHERRMADMEVCASDLCFKAAQQLISENNIDLSSVDMLLFLSQTPDYKIPATAPILQERLGLSKTTAALDLSLGCSGYVYALSTAFAYANTEGINRVLLLVGETFSKIVNRYDKVNAPLYGDAGTATLIEKGDFDTAYFTLYTDGSGADAVKIHFGEFRNYPLKTENITPREQEEGNIRADIEVYMNGMDVFNFALSVVPKSIKEIVSVSGMELINVDRVVFHQANRFMTDFFIKKLKLEPQKVPYCLDRYGNTSSASIPLTVCSELCDKDNMDKVIMCGFGAGLSWGTVLLSLSETKILPLVEY